jgi:hypothetical protein
VPTSLTNMVDTNFAIGCGDSSIIAIYDVDRVVARFQLNLAERLGDYVWLSKDAQPGQSDQLILSASLTAT